MAGLTIGGRPEHGFSWVYGTGQQISMALVLAGDGRDVDRLCQAGLAIPGNGWHEGERAVRRRDASKKGRV